MNELTPETSGAEREKFYKGALTIFYKDTPNGRRFLVAENAETSSVTFVSGAQEEDEDSLETTAQREVEEELGLTPDEYDLKSIDVQHNFVFGPQKKNRAGSAASYQVFVADLTNCDTPLSHTSELADTKWLSSEEVVQKLTFPDLQDVFNKTLEQLE